MAYYFSTDITRTAAEAILVPIFPGKKGELQDWCELVFREDYIDDLQEERRPGHNLDLGLPTVYVPERFGKVIFNFPVEKSESIDRLKRFMEATRTLFSMAESYHITSVAIGNFEKHLPWSLVETILLKQEQYRDEQSVELWLYPPWDDEDEVYKPSELVGVV